MSSKKPDIINSETVIETGTSPEVVSTMESTEETERIGKDIVIGRKEVGCEDGKNVISVIINAISVRIDMPRGTVKALLACLAVLTAAVILMVWNGHDPAADKKSGTDKQEAETQREYTAPEKSRAVNPERAADTKDYVIISARYRYDLPEGTLGVWEPEEDYEENETYCDFDYDGEAYTIRSYLLPFTNDGLEAIVKGSLGYFDGYSLIDEERVNSKFGEVLKIRFEVMDEEGVPCVVTGYYWSDMDPHICCLEVSADKWHEGEAEQMVLDSVYRTQASGTGSTAPPCAQEAYDEQMAKEAMDSLAEDAMNEYNEPEQDPRGLPY